MDSVSESNVATEYRTDADGIRTHAEHLTGEAKEIMLRIADDYDAMARTASNIFTAKRSLMRLAGSMGPRPPKHCPANCHAANANQRQATREQKVGCGIAVTTRAWACGACACIYTLEPFGHPRIWLK